MGTLSAEELAFIQRVDDEDRARGVIDAERRALLGHTRAQARYITRLEAALLEAKRALLDAAPMTTVAPDIEAIDAALSAQRGGE